MLIKIPILTFLIFGAIYPLSFWISHRDPLGHQFHKFHLGIANLTAGMAVISLFFLEVSSTTKLFLSVWGILLLSVTRFYWRKEFADPCVLTIPSLVGMVAFWQVQAEWISPHMDVTIMSILGGLILCASIFAMNLGHFYLNVHGLPINHLQKAVHVFGVALLVRAVLDVYFLMTSQVVYLGDAIPLYLFFQRLDGFLIVIALLFGTFFPLFSLIFVYGALQVKSTQSATGILYAILCAVIIGDVAYKYYLLKFGIVL
jgi:hypothetical protein